MLCLSYTIVLNYLKRVFFEIPPFDLRGLIDENINVHKNNIKVG